MAAADYMDFVGIMLDFRDVEEHDFTEQEEIEQLLQEQQV